MYIRRVQHHGWIDEFNDSREIYDSTRLTQKDLRIWQPLFKMLQAKLHDLISDV